MSGIFTGSDITGRGLPASHYLMFIGATVGAVAAFRLIRKREVSLNKRWFHGMLIVAAVSIAGWLLDNLIYHTRDIYDGGVLQEIFHTMESYGALVYFAMSIVVSLLIISRNRLRRS